MGLGEISLIAPGENACSVKVLAGRLSHHECTFFTSDVHFVVFRLVYGLSELHFGILEYRQVATGQVEPSMN